MALKITSEIGTDQGITNEAYVRIVNYNFNKAGQANFALQLFNSEAAATASPFINAPVAGGSSVARNAQIGDTFTVALTKEVPTTYTVQKSVPTEVEVTEEVITPGAEGQEPTTELVTKKVIQSILTDVEETTVKIVPDLSSLEGVDIFTFGYEKLKARLEEIFGEGNVVNC
jgi:hypothetical protein